MDRTTADRIAGGVLLLVIVVGSLLTWDAFRNHGTGGMGHDGMHATTSPMWYLFATVVTGAVVVIGYFLVRDTLTADTSAAAHGGGAGPAVGTGQTEEPATEGGQQTAAAGGKQSPSWDELLDLLPADERQVLEPVIESPGLTQVALRDRADFSKSKISQTVSELEKRGLLYRESQGRTYRVYPAADFEVGEQIEAEQDQSDARTEQ